MMGKHKPAAVVPFNIFSPSKPEMVQKHEYASMPNISPNKVESVGFSPNRKNNIAAAARRAATLREYERRHGALAPILSNVAAAPAPMKNTEVKTPMVPKPMLNIANARKSRKTRKARMARKTRKSRQ